MQFEPKDWVNPDGFGFFRVFSGQGLEDHFNIGSGWVQTLQKSLGYFNSSYREKETFGFFRVFSGQGLEGPPIFGSGWVHSLSQSFGLGWFTIENSGFSQLRLLKEKEILWGVEKLKTQGSYFVQIDKKHR